MIQKLSTENWTQIMQEQARDYRGMHPEDVKAAIRKKFRTIGEFHRVYDLPTTGLHDVLRGRASARVQAAMDEVLAEQESKMVDSTAELTAQHLNAGGK